MEHCSPCRYLSCAHSLQNLVLFLLFLLATPPLGFTNTKLPANGWMKTPTPESSQDNVSPSLRNARNMFFDSGIGSSAPLTSRSASAFHLAEGSHYRVSAERPPELPKVPNRTIIMGTFIAYRSVWTFSKRAIYTEVDISVSHVFEATGSVAEGTTVCIALPGGSVSTVDGNVVSFLTDPKDYFIEPNKKYLFVLSHHEVGDFYTIVKTWDLSSGVVRANSRTEQVRAEAGQSSIVGLTEDSLIPAVQELLSNEQ